MGDGMTDAELIRGIQAGDAALLPVLYERCLPSVWRYAYKRLGGNVHAAEDVVSETFVSAMESMSRFDVTKGALGGWLLGIARHKIAHFHRQRKAPRQGEGACESERSRGSGVDDPSTVLEAAEETANVLDALDRLAEEERIVLEWKYLDDCSVREIAGRLGRTEKAVENLLYRARLSFRQTYERRQDVPGGRLRSEMS
jgi:RNA polymerase sigma factor (sigma-70 family)